MSQTILPFSIQKSHEKLTDRANLAILDEYIQAIELPEKIQHVFPQPGSNRGIAPEDYLRTLCFYFADGGRHLEDIRRLNEDEGFNALINLKHMPGSDAVGDWLRRLGSGGGQASLQAVNDRLVGHYLAADGERSRLVLDVDASLIVSQKGDAKMSYKGQTGYHPMLGFLSNGTDNPCCSYVKFRSGNASAAADIEAAVDHTLGLLADSQRELDYFRSDSAGYQARLINRLNQQQITYSITAGLDEAVQTAIRGLSASSWKPLKDKDGIDHGQ